MCPWDRLQKRYESVFIQTKVANDGASIDIKGVRLPKDFALNINQ